MPSSSRSERLLRDTLRKDQLASSPTPAPTHRRRHSHVPPPSSSRHDDGYTAGSFLFRSAISPSPHYAADAEASRSSSPSPSPSYTSTNTPLRRHHSLQKHSSLLPSPRIEPLNMTPHEQVLRARLERVLHTGRGVVHSEEREDESARSRKRSNEVRDEAGGWPWRERENSDVSASVSTLDTPPPSNESDSHSHHSYSLESSFTTISTGNGHVRTKSKTDPTPRTPPPSQHLPLSPPSQHPPPRSPYYSHLPQSRPSTPRRGSTTYTHTPTLTASNTTPNRQSESKSLLTPPPTPPEQARAYRFFFSPTSTPSLPRGPSTPARGAAAPRIADPDAGGAADSGLGKGSPPASPTRPTFNVRKASARCREMEGYVSFASVEGLGEPPRRRKLRGASVGGGGTRSDYARGVDGDSEDDDESESGSDGEGGGRGRRRGAGPRGWAGWRRFLVLGGGSGNGNGGEA